MLYVMKNYSFAKISLLKLTPLDLTVKFIHLMFRMFAHAKLRNKII